MSRARRERLCGHHDSLGEGTVDVLSKHTEPDAQALLTSKTEFAPAARQTGVENDFGSELNSVDVVPDCVHSAGTVGAANVWQADRNAGHPVEDKKIEMVERRGL
jgi:hypothetical protein